MNSAKEFVRMVKSVHSYCGVEEALDLIYQEIDTLLRHSLFELVDKILREVDRNLPTVILLGFATITCIARKHLGEYVFYVSMLRDELTRRDPNRVNDLLMGLE